MKEKILAYVIGHIKVKDARKWAEYRSQVPATLAPWGADLRSVVNSGHQNHHAARRCS